MSPFLPFSFFGSQPTIGRLSEHDKKHLGFYVPKYVANFYSLHPGRYKGR
jgi:hypothetical protein